MEILQWSIGLPGSSHRTSSEGYASGKATSDTPMTQRDPTGRSDRRNQDTPGRPNSGASRQQTQPGQGRAEGQFGCRLKGRPSSPQRSENHGARTAELTTAVQHQLPVKIIVLKNNSLAEVKFEQRDLGNTEYGCDLSPIDFVAFARACGAEGFRCAKPSAVHGAIANTLRSPRADLGGYGWSIRPGLMRHSSRY